VLALQVLTVLQVLLEPKALQDQLVQQVLPVLVVQVLLGQQAQLGKVPQVLQG
jgi:hypothetical protein